MKLKFLFITLFICSLSWSQNKGTISGVILDKDLNNEPLSFANITLKGTTTGTSTDAEGKYNIEVTAGNYTLVISFLGYETVEIPCIVKEHEITTINKTIGSGSVSLSDVVVKSTVNREKETALMLEQKNAVVIKQSIGAQEMSRKGVSDVEEGLTKITGITKVDARGIFVRGLEDRYNNLLINNLAAPTNNPFKKIIPLDLFSTDIVAVIDVYKTFNPNIYGDFAGGTFDVSTSTGNKSITKLSLGTGFTTNNNLQDFLLSADANNTKGFFGFNGKTRELPSILQGKKPSGYTFTTPDSQKYFKSGFNVADTKSPLNTSIGVLHAEKFELKNDAKFSYLFSLSFDNEYLIKKGVDRTFDSSDTGFIYNTNFPNTVEYLYKTSSTSLLNLNYNVKKIKFSSSTIFIQTTENSIKDQKGSPRPGFDNQLIRTNQFTKTDYLNTQLSAEYAISENQTIKIAGSTAKTKYAQPDRKFFTGAISPSNNTINTFYGGNNFLRQYLAIDGDYYFSTLAEYNLKFGNKEHQNKLTIGYNGNNSSMQSSYRFIQSESQLAYFINPDINNIDTQIQSDLTNGLFNFKESSNGTYKVKLAEMANAGYANLLWKFNSKLEINAGLRFENTLKETKYRTLGSALDPYKKIKVTNSYFLPSLNTKYAVSEKTNLRFTVSKTYTKPVIMESFPLSYVNADGTGIQGNPLLVNSDNYNGDLKIEFFPTSKEMFAFGVFGKYLKNPIERINISNATTGTITSFLNSDNAKVYGIEAEFVLSLERLNQNLSNFTLGFNTTLMNSDVKVNSKYKTQDENGVVTETATIETHKSRKLQGASNFLVNSDLKYQFSFSKNWSNTASLVYSAFSKRIYAVGTVYQDHTYEIPYNQLDFVWSSKFNNHIDLKFTIDNITNPLRSLQLGNNGERPIAESDNTLKSYKRGTGFSLKLNYTF